MGLDESPGKEAEGPRVGHGARLEWVKVTLTVRPSGPRGERGGARLQALCRGRGALRTEGGFGLCPPRRLVLPRLHPRSRMPADTQMCAHPRGLPAETRDFGPSALLPWSHVEYRPEGEGSPTALAMNPPKCQRGGKPSGI